MKSSSGLLALIVLVSGTVAPQIRAGEADVPADIAQAFDRQKGAFYAIYARALRDDPRLRGKVTFQLTIDPGGTTSSCRVVSSGLHAPDVEKKMCERIKTMKFEPQAESRTVVKSLEFVSAVQLPAN